MDIQLEGLGQYPFRSDYLAIADFDHFTTSTLTSFEQQNSLASLPQTVAVLGIPFGKSL
jgi:hypothetical protein